MRIETSITINRPVEEVFAYVTDRENDVQWASPPEEVKKITTGPIGVGTRYQTVGHFLGRRIQSDQDVTEYQPNQKATYRVTKPFPFTWEYRFEPADGCTKLTFVVEGEVMTGFFRLAGPLLARAMRRQFDADLGNLKDMMETQPVASPVSNR